MKNGCNLFMKFILGSLLFFYFTSLIVFRHNYNNITWIIDGLMIAFYFLVLIQEKEKNFRINYLIIIFYSFITLSLFSAFYGIDFDSSMRRIMPLILLGINLFIIYNMFLNYKLLNFVLNGMLLGAFINYIVMLKLIHVPFDIYMGQSITNFRAIGTMGNPNVFATFMIISMLISFIYLFRKNQMTKICSYYLYINILLAFYMVLLSVSKQGIMMAVLLLIGYLFIILKNKRNWKYIFPLLVVLYFILLYFINLGQFDNLINLITGRFSFFSTSFNSYSIQDQFTSTATRKALIYFGLEEFQKNPLFGIGLGNFHIASKVLPVGAGGGIWAENNYMELLVDLGIFGTVLFYSMYIFTFLKIKTITNLNLKYLLSFFTFLLLLMDISSVTYGNKITIYSILLISMLIKEESLNKVSIEKEAQKLT